MTIYSSLNLAAANKWVMNIPFKVVDPSLTVQSVRFNLVNFTPAEITVSDDGMKFQGFTIPISTGVRMEDKTMDIRYLLNSDYEQYKFLYKWMNLAADEQNIPQVTMADRVCDITVFGLDEFKKPRIGFVYKGCWLKTISRIEYTTVPDIVMHGFTLKYAMFHLMNDTELPREMS